MNVDRMGGIAIGLESPKLGLTKGNLKVNAVEVEFLPIDAGHAVETEHTRRHGVG